MWTRPAAWGGLGLSLAISISLSLSPSLSLSILLALSLSLFLPLSLSLSPALDLQSGGAGWRAVRRLCGSVGHTPCGRFVPGTATSRVHSLVCILYQTLPRFEGGVSTRGVSSTSKQYHPDENVDKTCSLGELSGERGRDCAELLDTPHVGRALSRALSLSHTHPLSLIHTHTLSLSHTHYLFLSPSFPPSLSLSHPLSLSLSVQLSPVTKRRHLWNTTTQGPSRGHPRVVLETIGSFLEPFCGHISPNIDKVS